MSEGMKEYKIFGGKKFELFAEFPLKSSAQRFAKHSRYRSSQVNIYAHVETLQNGNGYVYRVYLRKERNGEQS